MTEKIKVLATGDWADTGFGTVMRNIFPRLAKTGRYEIHLVGWHFRGQPRLAKEARDAGIELYPTVGPEEGGGNGVLADMTGAVTCRNLAEEIKPDIFFGLGDPWQLAQFVTPVGKTDPLALNANIAKVFYVPVDTDILAVGDLKSLMKADALVVYSKFGAKVIQRQAQHAIVEFIPHGVDTKTFKPMDPEDREEFRSLQAWPENPWVVMVVGQNQVRKAHPRSMAAFKAATCLNFNARDPESVAEVEDEKGVKHTFSPPSKWCEEVQLMRCDLCPHYRPDPATESWVLHYHCAQDGIVGWNLPDLAHRFNLYDRVKSTKGISSTRGVAVEDLVRIMGSADTHLLLTHREGFGLPILEMMAVGVPNVATDYSSVPELLEEGGGVAVKVRDYNVSNFHNAIDAMADIADAARGLRRLFEDEGFRREQIRKGLEFSARLDWDNLTPQWDALFQRVRDRFKVTV